MELLDEIQRYLARCAARAGALWPPLESAFSELELKAFVRHTFARLGHEPAEDPVDEDVPSVDEAWDRVESVWLTSAEGWWFARLLWAHLFDQAFVQSDDDARGVVEECVTHVLRGMLHFSDEAPFSEWRFWANQCWEVADEPWRDPVAYAEALGLSHRDALTRTGRVLTRLRGRDAVRWLVAVEMRGMRNEE